MLKRTVVYTGDFKNAWNEDGCALQPLLCNVSNGEKKQLLTCGDSAHPPLKEPFKNKKKDEKALFGPDFFGQMKESGILICTRGQF